MNTLNTPWGLAEDVDTIADGIISVTTAGHGGIHLSPERNGIVHPVWRQSLGWYEEDCAWAIVAITFPALFTADVVDDALEMACEIYPDAYWLVCGVPPRDRRRRWSVD